MSKQETYNAFVFFNQAEEYETQREEFEAIWEYLDVDHDGQINADELAFGLGIQKDDNLITIPTPQDLLDLFDLDGNTDSLTYKEAANAFWTFYPDATQEEFDDLFNFLDFNGDRLIDAEELYIILYGYPTDDDDQSDWSDWSDEDDTTTPKDVLYAFDWSENGRLDFSEAAGAFFTYFPDASYNDYVAAWYASDINADGEIDIDELAVAMEKIENGVPLFPEADY